MGASTSSANRIIHRVNNMIASMHKEFISFPQTDVGKQKLDSISTVDSQVSSVQPIVRIYLSKLLEKRPWKYTETGKGIIP